MSRGIPVILSPGGHQEQTHYHQDYQWNIKGCPATTTRKPQLKGESKVINGKLDSLINSSKRLSFLIQF